MPVTLEEDQVLVFELTLTAGAAPLSCRTELLTFKQAFKKMIGFFLSLFLGDSGPIDAGCGYLLEAPIDGGPLLLGAALDSAPLLLEAQICP